MQTKELSDDQLTEYYYYLPESQSFVRIVPENKMTEHENLKSNIFIQQQNMTPQMNQ